LPPPPSASAINICHPRVPPPALPLHIILIHPAAYPNSAMQRANIVASSFSSISSHSIVRSYNRRALISRCSKPPFPSLTSALLSDSRTSFIPALTSQHQLQSQAHSLLQRKLLTMRHLSTSNTGPHNRNESTQKKRFGSFASKAFVVTATASTSFAAYYCATAVLFSSVATVSGDASGDLDRTKSLFNEEKKKDDIYGIEYVGFDSYAGVDLDDGTGVATKEYKAASAEAVSKALDAAGLDQTGMTKGITAADGDDNTLHPKHAHRVGLGTCPSYGCPFLPLDVHYDEQVKLHLENMRKDTPTEDEQEYLLKSSGSEKAATLTLIGYKGGELNKQINQDRALALAPYLYGNINSSSNNESNSDSATTRPVARLTGAFDGHATYGEKVSEYVAKTLPALLGSKLVEYEATSSKDGEEVDQHQKDLDIGKILAETFLELDATSPAEPSGGCTASVVLQLGTKIYIANAGDSRSFVGAYITPPSQSSNGNNSDSKPITSIIFGTREDKPHLSTERVRVEHMGGTVYLPNGFLDTGKGTTRVLYKDPTTGSTSGLAMSRSIGDWDAGAVGVIPDPLIDILDIEEIKKRVLDKLNGACDDKTDEVEIDPASGESVSSKDQCLTYTEKDVKLFAISATDGLLDYLPEQSIVDHVAKGLYETKGVNAEGGDTNDEQQVSNPLLACEDLIYAAAQGWQEDKGGRYRDDIAISVTELEV